MTVDYSKLDAAIVADVTARPRRGYRDFDTAKPLARQISESNMDRVLDRRFQSLRKRGLIARKDGSWTLPEPPIGQPPDLPAPTGDPVAWRFWVDRNPERDPYWTEWSTCPHERELFEARGYTPELASPWSQPAAT